MEKVMKRHLIRDGLIVLFSVYVAFFLSSIGVVDWLVSITSGFYIVSSFIAGMFFTSVFTTAPAIVLLGSIGSTNPPLIVALVGGLGALIGDFIIFRFFKKDLSQDVDYALTLTHSEKIQKLLELKTFRWFITSIGALIIASPLPDELGLAFLGLSRIPFKLFVPISFVFNVIGIYIITILARTL
jgi:xanthosine utilization system XapX-like protein